MHFTTFVTLATLAVTGTNAASCSKGHRRHHSKVASALSSSASASTRQNWQATSSSASSSVAQATATAAVALAAKAGSKTASASASWSSKASSTSSASTSSSSASSSSSTSSNSTLGWGLQGLQKNGVYFGFLPDDGSGGGSSDTISTINSAMGGTSAAQGWYAQAVSGTLFTGEQFGYRKEQILSGGVFQPAVMPTGGWWGLTNDDNQQAVAICTYLKEYTDAGVEVWLRFAHEVNYYLSDGTYSGTIDDFKEGWSVVASTCKSIAPDVKMWYTPNVASLDEYDEYFPDDASTVDLIGVDWYPKITSGFDFANGGAQMQEFHDKYCTSDGIKFAIGEIGLGVSATIAQRLAWLENIMESASTMEHMISVSWFNYYKDAYSYKVAAVDGDSVVKAYFA